MPLRITITGNFCRIFSRFQEILKNVTDWSDAAEAVR